MKYALLLLFIFLLFLIKPVLANPIVLPPITGIYDVFYLGVILPISFLVTVLIESIILYLFFRTYFLRIAKLWKSVAAINFLTFPMAQIIGILFANLFLVFIGFYFFAELIPTLLEFLLYSKVFDDFNERKYLREPVPSKIILIGIVIANLITFSLGLIMFLPYLINYYVLGMYPNIHPLISI